jgi:hypothetical protein
MKIILEGNEVILEADLLLPVILGLSARANGADGLAGEVILPSFVILIALHFLKLLLDQLHGFVLIVARNSACRWLLIVAVQRYASAELLQHIQLYIFQMFLLENFLLALESDASF